MIKLAQQGDIKALQCIFAQYQPLIKSTTRKYFIPNMSRDDIKIEAMVGLWNAIKNYRQEKSHLFSGLAVICVTRQVIGLLRTANKERGIRFTTLDRVTLATTSNPVDILIAKDILNNILSVLSKLERKILLLHIRGFSYTEIATKLNITNKSVDNGLTRIRAKAKLVVSDYLHSA